MGRAGVRSPVAHGARSAGAASGRPRSIVRVRLRIHARPRARPLPRIRPAPTRAWQVVLPSGSWPTLFLACGALFAAQCARLACSYLHLRRLKDGGRPASREQQANFDAWILTCGIRRPVRLLISSRVPMPVAIGFRHPAVVLPEALLAHLTAAELDHVLLHELAHIARRDDWTNLLARLAWAILTLHPVARACCARSIASANLPATIGWWRPPVPPVPMRPASPGCLSCASRGGAPCSRQASPMAARSLAIASLSCCAAVANSAPEPPRSASPSAQPPC